MTKPLTKTEAAVMSGTTVYRKSVKRVADGLGKTEKVIKKSTNLKLGKIVTANVWKGAPIYTVTLEERATCPRSCAHWVDCYGNNMPFALRYAAGPDLEAKMESELEALQAKHAATGFVVRLHVLGDFYTVNYVKLWANWLRRFPALRVYGYSAQVQNAIGLEIIATRSEHGQRFSIRFSGDHDSDDMTALSLDDERTEIAVAAREAFICPEQTGKVDTCAACGLCWMARKPVAFVTH